MTVLEGRVLAGRYRLEERIGAGGMGQVWRALDTVLDRPVAVKLLAHAGTEDPTTTERFAREARATAALNHPNVVTVHDSGIEDDLAFIVMELLPGPSLADELARGPLAVDLVEQVARDVLAGLGAAHALGLVHRDIKPGNVVRAADGRWRVVDFGISRLGDSSDGGPDGPLTATHVVIGTADYLAPEQALGRPVDGRADLYARGCVLWTLLAGHVPLSGGHRWRRCSGTPTRPSRGSAPSVPRPPRSSRTSSVASRPRTPPIALRRPRPRSRCSTGRRPPP